MKRIKWAVAVITCPRPGGSKLEATLASIESAGFPKPLVSCDAEQTLGAYGNWRSALEWAVGRKADRVLILEDDIELSAGLAAYLDIAQPPPDGIASLYSAAPNDDGRSFGWLPVKVPQRAYGALAYSMATATAVRFLKSPPLTNKPHGTDHAVGVWCKQNGEPYRVHAPSFVVHRGDASCLPDAGNPECRQCANWIQRVSVSLSQGGFRATTETVRMASPGVRPAGSHLRR